MPTEETLLRAYGLPPDEYKRFFKCADFGLEEYQQSGHDWQRGYAAQYVRGINLLCPDRGSLLEVGCSSGAVLEAAAEAGWQTAGVDPSTVSSRGADTDRRLGIQRKSLFDADLEPESFDLVFAASVLEHLADPARHLKQIHDLLKPGGQLLLAALPNVQSFTIRLGVDRYVGNHPPGHVQFFSRSTARRLLERNGFMVDRIRVFGMPETILELVFGRPDPLVPATADRVGGLNRGSRWRERALHGAKDAVYWLFDVFDAGSVMEVNATKRGRSRG
jgi:SAM-dependent methyltransferase